MVSCCLLLQAATRAPAPEYVRARVLEVVNGIPVCEWRPEWDASDGGVYVGAGTSEVTRSILRGSCAASIPSDAAKLALHGRPLYLLQGKVDCAKGLIRSQSFSAGECWNAEAWRSWLRFWLVNGVSSACWPGAEAGLGGQSRTSGKLCEVSSLLR